MSRSRTSELILNAATVVAALSAVVVVVGMVRRGDFRSGNRGEATTPAPKRVDDWAHLVSSGHRIGSAKARLVLVEFADFECPACASFAHVVDSLQERHPNDFALVYHHFPLDYHARAYPLARASECAAQQGAFGKFYHAAFTKQRELGLNAINRLAELAGIPDVRRFAACAADTARVASIDADMALAMKIGIPGTPGIIVDGYLRENVGTLARIEALLDRRAANPR